MKTQASAPDKVDALQQEVVDFNERQWLPRHCRGDQEAFAQLLQTYRTLVYTLLWRYGIEQQHCDDLFQDIFLKVHQSAASYRPAEPLRPWLISIVLNSVRNFRRDHGRKKHFMTHLRVILGSDGAQAANASASAPPPHTPGLDEQMEQQATVLWLQTRINTLPERQREVLVLATIKGLSMKEIATILKLPENTVKTHLRRARLSLAEGLLGREQQTASAAGNSPGATP